MHNNNYLLIVRSHTNFYKKKHAINVARLKTSGTLAQNTTENKINKTFKTERKPTRLVLIKNKGLWLWSE
jgi:hypothetical protein